MRKQSVLQRLITYNGDIIGRAHSASRLDSILSIHFLALSKRKRCSLLKVAASFIGHLFFWKNFVDPRCFYSCPEVDSRCRRGLWFFSNLDENKAAKFIVRTSGTVLQTDHVLYF